MKPIKLTAFLFIATFFLSSCAGMTKEQSGQTVGSVLGALAGYNLGKGHKDQGWAIGLGALYGAAVGRDIGRQLDERDKELAEEAFQNSLENNQIGAAASWNNPDTGHAGDTIPTKTYTADSGNPCREFTTTVLIGGEEQQGYGTACRQADGSWKIIN